VLKLTLRQKIRIWLWQHRRGVIIALFCLPAPMLILAYNSLLGTGSKLLPLLTLTQLGVAALLVIIVIILSD
jgi:hypothetical protein